MRDCPLLEYLRYDHVYIVCSINENSYTIYRILSHIVFIRINLLMITIRGCKQIINIPKRIIRNITFSLYSEMEIFAYCFSDESFKSTTHSFITHQTNIYIY